MNNEKLIAKYFKGALTEREALEFDKLLKINADFKVEVDLYRDIQVAFKLKEEEELKGFLKNIEAKDTSTKFFNSSKRIVLITAACLIIGAFFFLNKPEDPNDIYASYFEVYPNVLEPIVRGKTTTNNEALRAYENEDYKKAEVVFDALLKTNTNTNLEFYYAMALLNQNKFDEAKIILNNLKTKPQDFEAETYWYSTLIAFKQANFQLAKKNLEALNARGSKFKIQERAQLLKLLD